MKGAGKLLLVGTVPLETVEEVFRTCAQALGRHAYAFPNGEVGALFFPEPEDREKAIRSYQRSNQIVVEKILERVPASELVVEWDYCSEVITIIGAEPTGQDLLDSPLLKEPEVFLGVELPDGIEAMIRRIDAAKKHLPDFGISHYCGYGREEPLRVPQLLDDIRLGAERLARDSSLVGA